MLAEFQGQQRVHPVFEITLGGKEFRFSDRAVASDSKGTYLPHIEKDGWGTFERIGDDDSFNLTTSRSTVTVLDESRELQKELGGKSKGAVRDSVAKCFYRSDFVPAADHWRFFNGVCADWRIAGDRKYQFVLEPDQKSIDSNLQINTINQSLFSSMPLKFIGRDGQVVYGTHNSGGVTGATGMIKAIPIEPINISASDPSVWFCSWGWLEEITNVWVGGTLVNSSNVTLQPINQATSGLAYAKFILDAGEVSSEDDVVTFDAIGLHDNFTPPAGNLISNPAAFIRHVLSNFVFGRGALLAVGASWQDEDDVPVASAIFDRAATFFSIRGMETAKVLTSSDTGRSVFNGWCGGGNFRAVPFYTDEYKIGAIPNDPSEITIYKDADHIAQRRGDALGELSQDTSGRSRVTDITVNYILNDATSTLAKQNRSSDLSIATQVGESVDLLFGKSRLI